MANPRGKVQLRAAIQSILDGPATKQWSELENELMESERKLALSMLGYSPGIEGKAEMLAQIFDADKDSSINLDDGFPVLFAGLDEAAVPLKLSKKGTFRARAHVRTNTLFCGALLVPPEASKPNATPLRVVGNKCVFMGS